MALERLTRSLLRRAEAGGKTKGWYALCKKGYLPAEIAVHAEPSVYANDVVQRVRDHAETHNLPIPLSCARKREVRTPAPITDWRAAFRTYAMRTGLSLSLTQPMLDYLCATSSNVLWDRYSERLSDHRVRPNCSIVTGACLEKRGLIRRKPDRTEWDTAYDELTDAGKLVIELLKCVGVFVEADAAIAQRRVRRR